MDEILETIHSYWGENIPTISEEYLYESINNPIQPIVCDDAITSFTYKDHIGYMIQVHYYNNLTNQMENTSFIIYQAYVHNNLPIVYIGPNTLNTLNVIDYQTLDQFIRKLRRLLQYNEINGYTFGKYTFCPITLEYNKYYLQLI